MQITKFYFMIGMTLSLNSWGTIPLEVLDSCKNSIPAKSTVTITSLEVPAKQTTIEPGCMDHYETTNNGLNYGYVTCNSDTSLIIKGVRYSLNNAENHSVNPAVPPKGDIYFQSYWSKINFNDISYLCLNTPLSTSGKGGDIMQHYIVENAYNTTTPIIHFYFFNKEITPISSM